MVCLCGKSGILSQRYHVAYTSGSGTSGSGHPAGYYNTE